MSEINLSTNNVMLDEDKLYPVDKIVGRRVKKGKVEYLVRWKNYPPDTDSWEPSKSISTTCLPLIKEFNKDKLLNSNLSVPTSTDSSNDTLVTSSKNHDKIFHNESNSLEKSLKSSLNHSKFKNSELNKTRSKENIKSQLIPDKTFSETYEKRQLEITKLTKNNSEVNNNFKNSIKDNQTDDNKPNESVKDQKKVIYLEDNEIDEPCVSKSKNSSINGIIKKSFTSNTEKVSNVISKNTELVPIKVPIENLNNNLKRKSTSVVIANQKKTKLIDKESKINPISFIEKDQIQKFNILSRLNNSNNNNNIIINNNNNNNKSYNYNNNIINNSNSNNNNNNNHNCCNTNYGPLLPPNKAAFDFDNYKCKNFKSSNLMKPQLISEEKIEKSFGKLPFQRYKESDHLDNNDITETRRTSIRQIEATNRFREIIVRKNVNAGFTEICLHNNSHSFPNCFNIKILNELYIAFKQAVNDSSRVILLSAIGSVFSSGIDLETIISSPQKCVSNVKNIITSTAQLTTPIYPNQQIHDLAESLKKFLLELLHFPKPIVVGINGPAIGLGCAILPLCDLIYATESSSFYLPYTTLSQTPEAGSSLTLPMLVGMPTANQLLLCGRKWSAKEAFNKGLISEIIFSDKFKPELFSRCEKLAHVPSMSAETMKCMLRIHYKEQIDLTINMECRKLIEIWKSNEFRNSAQSFIDRELPNLLL